MNQKMQVRRISTICFLLILLIMPVSAIPDALMDRSRTQFGDLKANQITYINTRFQDVKGDIFFLPYIYSIKDYTTGASSDSYFITNGINSLDNTNDNIVLIHTHGTYSSSTSSSYLKFKDNSLLSGTDVTNWMSERRRPDVRCGMQFCKIY